MVKIYVNDNGNIRAYYNRKCLTIGDVNGLNAVIYIYVLAITTFKMPHDVIHSCTIITFLMSYIIIWLQKNDEISSYILTGFFESKTCAENFQSNTC